MQFNSVVVWSKKQRSAAKSCGNASRAHRVVRLQTSDCEMRSNRPRFGRMCALTSRDRTTSIFALDSQRGILCNKKAESFSSCTQQCLYVRPLTPPACACSIQACPSSCSPRTRGCGAAGVAFNTSRLRLESAAAHLIEMVSKSDSPVGDFNSNILPSIAYAASARQSEAVA